MGSLAAIGCQSNNQAPQDKPDEKVDDSYGQILNSKGKPVSGASVNIVQVSFSPTHALEKKSAVIFSMETDSLGRYSLKDIPPDQYNIQTSKDSLVSFQDSVDINKGTNKVKPDTLKIPGSLSGTVELQPNHSPVTVTIQLLGTTIFTNVDSKGHFELGGLADGIYNARIASTLPDYTPLYTGFIIKTGVRTEVRGGLRIPFTGIPAVVGVAISYDTAKALARITWHPADYENLLGYAVFRDSLLSQNLSIKPLNTIRIDDTSFVDALFSSGKYSLKDTAKYEYRVLVQAKNAKYSEAFESIRLIGPSPAHVRTYSQFKTWVVMSQVPSPRLLDSASINDTVLVVASYINATRRHKSTYWTVNQKKVSEKILSKGGFQGVDTLVYVAGPKPEFAQMLFNALDDAGSLWTDTLRFKVVSDSPVVANRNMEEFIGDTVLLRGVVAQQFGFISKWEWDIGNTGKYVEYPNGEATFVVPKVSDSVISCALRVTDDDGQMDTGWITVTARPYREIKAMPEKRWFVKAVKSGDKIYGIGGTPTWQTAWYGAQHNDLTPASSVYEYDPVKDTWATKASMATPRFFIGAASLGDTLFAVGGRNSEWGAFNTLELYDKKNDKWSTKSPMPSARASLEVVVVNGKLLAIGGKNYTSDNVNTVEEYDPKTDKWTAKSPMKVARGEFSAIVWNGMIYVFGGEGDVWTTKLSSVEKYDPILDQWSDMPAFISKGINTGVGINGKAFLLGNAFSNAVTKYDLATGVSERVLGSVQYEYSSSVEWAGKVLTLGDRSRYATPAEASDAPKKWAGEIYAPN